jgi:predicted RNA-binding protein with PUA-like domain
MSYWLLKTEPNEYSWSDLTEAKDAAWDGVKAPAAINNIKQMQPGDLAFIYHTGSERSIVGIAKITSMPYLNPLNHGWEFKLAPVEQLTQAITLKQIKESGRFPDWELVRLPRLSVVPVNPEQWNTILHWSLTSPL